MSLWLQELGTSNFLSSHTFLPYFFLYPHQGIEVLYEGSPQCPILQFSVLIASPWGTIKTEEEQMRSARVSLLHAE